MSLLGQLLVAAPTMRDPNFTHGVVLVCAHNDDGAMGVLLNRPTDIQVADHLPELAGRVALPAVVFLGGPVQTEVALGIATGNADIDRWTPVVGDTGVIDVSSVTGAGRTRVFAGYSGWGAGQLDAEVAHGDWLIVAAHPDDAFDPDPAGLRRRVLARQKGPTRLYADYPEEPRLN